ncbi:MAG TPA: hypothetical protein VLE99_00030 [Candidatus Saccharimonadales bacterium]|nr:hypothetical protein [Candidatus Saccharimonadales bacterium]
MKRKITYAAAAWAALFSFLLLIRPDNLPVVVLIVPFVLLFLALYQLWGLLALFGPRYLGSSGKMAAHPRLGMVACGTIVLLLVLQSLGQLSLRDVFTVLAILMLGYLYLGRSRFVLPRRQ